MRGYIDDEEFQRYKEEKEERKRKRRRIITYIIIIILIILSLITSCSCTGLIGKVGDLFRNEGTYPIDDKTDDKEVILNRDLQFDADTLEISVSDEKPKIGFHYQNINPGAFTCSTSNADIATCYVKDDYVVIIPKKPGSITVSVQTEANGYIYRADANVTIKDIDRFIVLESKGGTLNLVKSKTKYIRYTLVGLDGDVKVNVSDSSIATVSVEKGKLKVTGLKTGTVKITVSLEYNGKTYTAEYTLKVVKTSDSGKPEEGGIGDGDSSSPSIPDTPPTPGEDNPSKPGEDKPVKESSFLKSLTISDGTLEFSKDTFEYFVYLPQSITHVTLKDEPESSKAKVTYTLDGEVVGSLNNLKLHDGNNIVNITVTTPTGETSYYTVVIKRCYLYPDSYNKEMTYIKDSAQANVILHTNIFDFDFSIEKLENGIRLVSKKDKNTYIDITTESALTLDVKDTSNTSAIALLVESSEVGIHTLHVSGTASKTYIDGFDITLEVKERYEVLLDGNGGFYGDNSSNTSYKGLLTSFDTLDLSKFIFYKPDVNNKCYYYTLESFNTKKDGSGKVYDKNTILSNITEDLTLFAIYSTIPKYIELEDTHILYLVDVPLFYNKEGEQKYNDDHLIYPGAQGSYTMNVKNTGNNDITITGMNLEESTICIPDKGCLNMGYTIRYAEPSKPFHYYYGGTNKNKVEYTILNQDNDSIHTDNYKKHVDFTSKPIKIRKGETVEIFLLWKWVEVDDDLDTKIGTEVAKQLSKDKKYYGLTVSIEFDKKNAYCVIE